jgi:hypothetical protein
MRPLAGRNRFAIPGDAEEPAAATAQRELQDDELTTPTITVSGEAAARFTTILAEQTIEMQVDENRVPAEVGAALAKAVSEDGGAVEAVLVEGSQEQIDALVAALRPENITEQAAVRRSRAATRAAAPLQRGDQPRGYAWRLPPARQTAEAGAATLAAAPTAADSAVRLQANEPTRGGASAARVRVLFLLQPPDDEPR